VQIFRCPTCDYQSHRQCSRDLHAATCFGFPSEEDQIARKVAGFDFGAEFQGARVSSNANDSQLMSLGEACSDSPQATFDLFNLKLDKANAIPVSVALYFNEQIDQLIFGLDTSTMKNLVIGWATRELGVRSSKRHPADVVDELRKWFDHTPRLNADQIAVKLKEVFHFGRKCLRVQQITGWISQEKKRRRDGTVKEAMQKAGVDAVHEAEAASCQCRG